MCVRGTLLLRIETSVILPNFNEGIALISYTEFQIEEIESLSLTPRYSHRANNALLFEKTRMAFWIRRKPKSKINLGLL